MVPPPGVAGRAFVPSTEIATSTVLFLITTSLVELHVPFVSVQRSVISVFVGTSVIVDVAELGVAMVAVPYGLTKLHAPVPTVATAAIVNVEVLHNI